MKYAHIINFFNSQPWAILPETLHALISLIELRASGLTISESDLEAAIGGARQQELAGPDSVAIIPVTGVITHRSMRSGLFRFLFRGTTVEDLRADIRAALGNESVKAIVLDFDTPGGGTSAIEELSDEIYAARSKKRIIASVNTLAASAGYWLASSAHEIVISPSGHTGSIGVLGTHMDFSEQAKAQGVAVSIISAGRFKAEASEFTPLNESARAHLQGIVDDRYDAFVRAVARGRKTSQKSVREGFGEGRVVTAKEALSLGMVDSIDTIDQVLSGTAKRAARARTIAEDASWRLGITGDETELETAVAGATAEELLSQERSSFKPQTLVAPKKKWSSLDAARSWAKEHGYRVDKVDETDNAWRFRQRDPGDFKQLRSVCINPGRTTPATIEACKMIIVGGQLKAGVAAILRDPEAEGVDEFISVGIVPLDASDAIAPDGTDWRPPELSDFTDSPWASLSDEEKRRIASYCAWAESMPPKDFGELHLFHHRQSDGAVVPRAVHEALRELAAAKDGSEKLPPWADHDTENATIATTNFVGSPRNKYGTHASKGFKGSYESAWRLHFSQVNGGSLSPAASGPIRGTVRRVAMIAAAMKPKCNVAEAEGMGARGGPKSPLPGKFPEKPSDYGLKTWAKPSDDGLDQKDVQLTCADLNVIKRTAVAEIKRRIKDREAAKEKSSEARMGGGDDALAMVGDSLARVEAHLKRHMEDIEKRRGLAKTDPNLDADRVALELMELG